MEFMKQLNQHNKIAFQGGVALSVQAGLYYYSNPRQNGSWDEFTHVEMGIVGTNIDGVLPLVDYIESKDAQLTVYAYVPIELVEQVFQYLKTTYGLLRKTSPSFVLQKTKPNDNQTEKLGSSIMRTIKQQALVRAIQTTNHDEWCEALEKELEKTIRFTEE